MEETGKKRKKYGTMKKMESREGGGKGRRKDPDELQLTTPISKRGV